MRLFRRGRTSRAPATIRTVETTDRLDHLCQVDVLPDLAPRFASVLRTRLDVLEAAETFVLYDPRDHAECSLDEDRLRSSGIEAGRGYTRVPGRREHITGALP